MLRPPQPLGWRKSQQALCFLFPAARAGPALTYAPARAAVPPPPPFPSPPPPVYTRSPTDTQSHCLLAALPRPSGFQMRPAEPPSAPQLTHPGCLGEGTGEGAVRPGSPVGPSRRSAPPPPGNPLFLSPRPRPPSCLLPWAGASAAARPGVVSAPAFPPPLRPRREERRWWGEAQPLPTPSIQPARVSLALGEPLSWLGPKLPRLIFCLKPGDLPQSSP